MSESFTPHTSHDNADWKGPTVASPEDIAAKEELDAVTDVDAQESRIPSVRPDLVRDPAGHHAEIRKLQLEEEEETGAAIMEESVTAVDEEGVRRPFTSVDTDVDSAFDSIRSNAA